MIIQVRYPFLFNKWLHCCFVRNYLQIFVINPSGIIIYFWKRAANFSSNFSYIKWQQSFYFCVIRLKTKMMYHIIEINFFALLSHLILWIFSPRCHAMAVEHVTNIALPSSLSGWRRWSLSAQTLQTTRLLQYCFALTFNEFVLGLAFI